jgi:hypothetical protein
MGGSGPDVADVEPLAMPPMVLYAGSRVAFLLRWRRTTAGGRVRWWGEVAVPAVVDTAGGPVPRLDRRWVSDTHLSKVPGVDYGAVPRPGPG